MKQQIVVIHGGTAFDNYDDYLGYLNNQEIYLDRLRGVRNWKENLQENLGNDFDVILANMPNKQNAKYVEWAIYFNKLVSLLDDDLILIGHSLGGIFLAKFLSENILPKKIKKLILVSAPFDGVNEDESLGDFELSNNLEKVTNQCQKIILVHSKDDNVVPYEEVLKYKDKLSKAVLMTFENKDHFSQESFPEMLKIIKDNL